MKVVNKPVYIAASLLAVLGVIAVSYSGSFSAFAQEAGVHVTIPAGASTLGDKSYVPNPVEVKVGQSVEWENEDTMLHTVTSGTAAGTPDAGRVFDSGFTGLTAKGNTFKHTFTAAGEFPYFCQVHPGMVGKVVVK